jgi:molybdate transport system permease protein
MSQTTDTFALFRSNRKGMEIWKVGAGFALILLLVLLGFPLLSLLFRVSPVELLARLQTPVVMSALRLSLITSVSSAIVVIILGLPVALLLASSKFPGKRVLEVVINLPMVLPPTVAGLGLLLAFGRSSVLGSVLSVAGISIPFTTFAVVLAQTFVAAPFFINTARAGFESIEPRYLQAAATLRASPGYTFFHVVLPLSLHSLVAGAAMSWARALGEFGATITFAGNMPGRTQTMPLAVYIALQTDVKSAVALSVILLAVSFGLLFVLRSVVVNPGK